MRLSELSKMLLFVHEDAVLKCWRAAFVPKMPPMCFEGRGWGKAPCKMGQQPIGEMTKETITEISSSTYQTRVRESGRDQDGWL